MLQNKDIKNLSELKSTFLSQQKKSEFFFDFIDILKIGKFHSIFSKVKSKGISVLLLIRIMISFPFIDKENIHKFTRSSYNQLMIGKDAFYRLKNNCNLNWRKFLISISLLAIKMLELRRKNDKEQLTAFVFDDTSIHKTGYKIEGVSRIWNHVIKKHILGYQLLVMGFFNGTSLLPVNFSFHRERGKKEKKKFGLKPSEYRNQFSKQRDNKSCGFKRKKELDITKIDATAQMISFAIEQGLRAKYVLTDSWFTCWKLVKLSIDNNMHYVGMFSKVKTLFTYNNKKQTYKNIRRINRGKQKRNRKFNLYYIKTEVDWNGTRIVIYNTRKGKNGNWKTIISTDVKSNFNKTLEIYQIRWSIEVLFKEAKQMLNLGKSQSNDFDGQITDVTISFIQYIFLSIKNNVDKYETKGGVFEGTKEDILETKLHQRLIMLLIAILEAIEIIFENIDIDELFIQMINNEEAYSKIKKLIA